MALTQIKSSNITDGTIVNADMAADAIGISQLSATGTASATTYLRGDNAWADVGADTSLSNLVAAGADKIVKAWVCFDGDPLAIRDSFNVSSITDVGVGTWTVNWDTDFANASYAVVAGGSASSGGGDYMQTQNTNTVVGSTPVYAYNAGGGTTWDPNYVSIVAIGDQ